MAKMTLPFLINNIFFTPDYSIIHYMGDNVKDVKVKN